MAKTALPPLDEADRAAVNATAAQLVEVLGETEHGPKAMIWRLVRVIGVEPAQALLEETRQIEAHGGMLTADASRRRTMGGVYLSLARQRLKGQPVLTYVFPYPVRVKAKPTAPAPATKAALKAPFVWSERQVVIEEAVTQSGGSTSMKVTLVGRPGKVILRDECVITSMPTMKIPALPKGVPVPDAATQTQVLVYIGAKQWKKVAAAIEHEDDVLIVEGFGVYDPQIKGMALLASNVTTKALQQAKRVLQATES